MRAGLNHIDSDTNHHTKNRRKESHIGIEHLAHPLEPYVPLRLRTRGRDQKKQRPVGSGTDTHHSRHSIPRAFFIVYCSKSDFEVVFRVESASREVLKLNNFGGTDMASSKHPIEIVDAPVAVERFAHETSGICINTRVDKWPEDVLTRYRTGDARLWGMMVSLHEARLTAPWLTDFLKKLKPGDSFLASVQGAGEDIYTVIGQIKEIFWIDNGRPPPENPCPYGKLAAIRPVKDDYKCGLIAGFQIWTSYVLAIACVSEAVPPNSWKDPEGERFLKLAKKAGIRVLE